MGTIVIIDVQIDCTEQPFINDKLYLNRLLEALTIECGLTKVNECIHKFEPQGYTICHVLAESHISIHTWPENNAFAMDIYSCKHDLDVDSIQSILKHYFSTISKINIQKLHRFI